MTGASAVVIDKKCEKRNDCSLPFTWMETIQHEISKWKI